MTMMAQMNGRPTIGLEEEMFLVDAETYDCVPEMPARFERDARRALGDHFEREMISSMIELISSCHSDIASLNAEVLELRYKLGRVAARHGFALMACGTHPFSKWPDQKVTDDGRYRSIAQTVQQPAIRGHACGLHIHVGLPGCERVAVMNSLRPYLPLFLALSTSSPFWQGRATGLKSYRTAVNCEMPRSGLPPAFLDEKDYAMAVTALTDAAAVPDESFIWWALRPSFNHPTVELRICDSCTRLQDAIVIGEIYRALFHHHARSGCQTGPGSGATEVLLDENRWQAARHGIDARFINLDGTGAADLAVVLRGLANLMPDSIAELQCESALTAAAHIVANGTSADRQLKTYAAHACVSHHAAMTAVATSLCDETNAMALCPAG
jgi:carboxylate-amine ligase